MSGQLGYFDRRGRPRGRPPSEFKEEYLEHVRSEVIRYLGALPKGKAVSIHKLEEILGHRAEVIKKVGILARGARLDGKLEIFQADGRTYLAHAHRDGDPIICDHGYDATVVPVDYGAREVSCPDCGSTYRFYECVVCRGRFLVEWSSTADFELECPHGCRTIYRLKNGRLYALSAYDAFHYDFQEDWIYYRVLKCEDCGSSLELDFHTGSWYCSSCAPYRRPRHSYKWFRCTLPCGHDSQYSIWRLADDLPLRCPSCGHEVRLPDHVRLAWSEAEYTLLDVPKRVAVNNPLLAIAGLGALFGPLGFIAGLVLAKG